MEQPELTVEELYELLDDAQLIFEKTLLYFKLDIEYQFNPSVAEEVTRNVGKLMVADYPQLKYVDPNDL